MSQLHGRQASSQGHGQHKDDPSVRVAVQRLKYDPWGRKFFIRPPDDRTKDWSDEESDYLVKPKKVLKSKKEEDERAESKAAQVSMDDGRLPQIPNRQHSFLGHPLLDKTKNELLYQKTARGPTLPPFDKTQLQRKAENLSTREFLQPFPYIPPHALEALGLPFLEYFWELCCERGLSFKQTMSFLLINLIKFLGVTRQGRLYYSHVPALAEALSASAGIVLSLEEEDIEEDDLVTFQSMLDKISVFFSRKGMRPVIYEKPVELPSCCASHSCSFHLHEPGQGERSALLAQDQSEDNFIIDTVYKRYVLNKQGNVRLKDLPLIITEAGLAFDVSRISESDWKLHGEALLYHEECRRLTELLRCDVFIPEDINERLYRVPDWLTTEFLASEVEMFRNQFMIIDVDKGGSIDAYELQELTENLGSRISYEQAVELIAEFDLDRSGTIDFGEYLTLMFKIKAGTVAGDNTLVTAIIESKHQIRIYAEIEDMKTNPLPFVGVASYGGVPVVCNFVLQGPPKSAYDGGYFCIKVTYEAGYPYRIPTVLFQTRIFAVNVLTLVNGSGVLSHLSRLWDSKWTVRMLLEHIFSLLTEPHLPWLPPTLLHVLNSWLKSQGKPCIDLKTGMSVSGENEEEVVSEIHAAESYKDYLSRLSRVEQMHMNVLSLFICDRERYDRTVLQMTQQFALKNPLAHIESRPGTTNEAACSGETGDLDQESNGNQESNGSAHQDRDLGDDAYPLVKGEDRFETSITEY